MLRRGQIILLLLLGIVPLYLWGESFTYNGEVKARSGLNSLGGIVYDQYRLTNMGAWVLGNEGTGVDVNFGFSKSWTSDVGIVATSNVQFKASTENTVDWVNANLKLTQGNLSMQGFRFSPGAVVWAGKKEVLRSIHTLGWCYTKYSGFGMGVENLRIGDLSVEVALYDVVNSGWPTDTGYNETTNDETAGYYHIPTLKTTISFPVSIGTLEVDFAGNFIPSADSYTEVVAEDLAVWGFQTGAFLHVDNFFYSDEGSTDWGVQAGIGLPTGDNLGQNQYLNSQHEDAISIRIIHGGLYDTKKFDVMTAIAAQYDLGHVQSGNAYDEDNDNRLWITAGARPIFQINRNFAIQTEYGFEYLRDETRSGAIDAEILEGGLHKFTIAPAMTFGDGFWDRPVFRFYGTFAAWDPELSGLSLNYDYSNPMTAEGAFGDDRNMAIMYGISLEAWY